MFKVVRVFNNNWFGNNYDTVDNLRWIREYRVNNVGLIKAQKMFKVVGVFNNKRFGNNYETQNKLTK